jgi:hypothetical protein
VGLRQAGARKLISRPTSASVPSHLHLLHVSDPDLVWSAPVSSSPPSRLTMPKAKDEKESKVKASSPGKAKPENGSAARPGSWRPEDKLKVCLLCHYAEAMLTDLASSADSRRRARERQGRRLARARRRDGPPQEPGACTQQTSPCAVAHCSLAGVGPSTSFLCSHNPAPDSRSPQWRKLMIKDLRSHYGGT